MPSTLDVQANLSVRLCPLPHYYVGSQPWICTLQALRECLCSRKPGLLHELKVKATPQRLNLTGFYMEVRDFNCPPQRCGRTRNLEHDSPPTPSRNTKEHQHKSSYIPVPAFWELTIL